MLKVDFNFKPNFKPVKNNSCQWFL